MSSLVCVFVRVFFFPILWDFCTGDHPQEDLAKFGYRSERKVEYCWYPIIYWRQSRTNNLNIMNSTFFWSPNMKTLSHFFKKALLYTSCSHPFFGHQVVKFCHKKNTLCVCVCVIYLFIFVMYLKCPSSIRWMNQTSPLKVWKETDLNHHFIFLPIYRNLR